MKQRLLTMLFAVALCAACGSTATDDAAPQSAGAETDAVSVADGDESDSAPAAATADSDGETVNETRTSPLSEALGFSIEGQAAALAEYVRTAEEEVRRCMAERGFEYEPANVGAPQSLQRQWELEATLSPDAFLAQYGYGIATLFELDFQGEGVQAFVEQIIGPPPEVELSDAEIDAYQLELNGELVTGSGAEAARDQSFDQITRPPRQGSCRQVGYDAIENPGAVFDDLLSVLGDEWFALGDRFDSDPRIRELRAEWQRCMAVEGFAYEDSAEIRDEIATTAFDIGGRFQDSPEALAIFQRAFEVGLPQMNAEDRYDFLEREGALQGFSMVPALQVELDELIDFELEVSQVDHACGDTELEAEVFFELEADFVAAHSDQLALISRN